MKNIFKVLLFIISLGADCYTIYLGVDAVGSQIITNPPFWLVVIIWLIFVSTLLYVVCYSVILLLRNRCIKYGTHNIPCSLLAYFHAKCQNRTQTSINIIQGLYKEMVYARQIIKNAKPKYQNVNSRKDIVDDFLFVSRDALKKALFVNVSISLKTFCQKDDKSILQTYTYVIENLDDNNRTKKIDYILSIQGTEAYPDLKTWCTASKKYSEKYGRTPFASNSIFNYLVATGKGNWLSNNLCRDEVDGIFHTSSENRELYNSLGVFLVKSPDTNSSKSGIKGVLTFDSSKTNIFVEKECKLLMQFIAYCVYELLEDI